MQTYNQIIKLNKEFAENHFALKTFGNGPAYDIVLHDKQEWFSYPVMWMEDLPLGLNENELTFNYRVYFINQVATLKEREGDKMETNQNEVKSDMIQCALDLLSFWAQKSTYPDLNLVKSGSIIPIQDKFSDRVTGCYVDLKLKQGFKYNKCAIPMTGVTPPPSELCQDAILNINADIGFASIISGATLSLEVRDESDALVGFDDAGVWRVPTGFTLGRIYWKPPATGQKTSYWDGDTKWRIDNEIGKLVQPAYGTQMSLQYGKRWLLNSTNIFLNLFRRTGITGGYYDPTTGLYYDVDGVVTTVDLAFPDNLFADHMTSTLFERVTITVDQWTDAMDIGITKTIAGFTGWYLPDTQQLYSQADNGVFSGFRTDDVPLRWGNSSVITSDTYANNSAQAWGGTTVTQITPLTKANANQIVYMKEIDFNTEL